MHDGGEERTWRDVAGEALAIVLVAALAWALLSHAGGIDHVVRAAEVGGS